MTQLEEIVHIPNTNIKYAEEDNVIYHAGSTDEVRFFEHSMIMLKAMINTDSKDPIEILIPPPKQNIMGKVKKSYTHILDVARETRRLKTENQYLKTMLDNLHQNIIVGQATSQKEIKAPEGKMSDQTLIELTTNTQKITHRFYDLETELDYIHRRISQLSAMIDGAQGSEAQIPSQERTTKFTAKGRKPRSNHARATPETARSLKLENDLELIASAWRQMKETDRLSEIVGTKLTHENPSIADLSDPSRPTKLAERYSNLYDNQWTDAFTTLSKYYTEASDEKLAGSLYTILVDGYLFCERVRMRQKKNIEDIMLHPDISMEFNLRSEPDTVNDILAKLLSDAAKESSTVSSVNMAQAFIENDEMKNKYGKMMVSCKTYIEECVTLCWLMQVQTPPVCMDLKTAKGQVLQKDTYRHYTSKGIYIAFVVWPALFLYKDGPLLAKGVAEGDGKLHQKP